MLRQYSIVIYHSSVSDKLGSNCQFHTLIFSPLSTISANTSACWMPIDLPTHRSLRTIQSLAASVLVCMEPAMYSGQMRVCPRKAFVVGYPGGDFEVISGSSTLSVPYVAWFFNFDGPLLFPMMEGWEVSREVLLTYPVC